MKDHIGSVGGIGSIGEISMMREEEANHVGK